MTKGSSHQKATNQEIPIENLREKRMSKKKKKSIEKKKRI